MLAHLDSSEIITLGVVILVCCFFLGIIMDGLMEEDGFGPTGNMFVMSAGAFIGIQTFIHLGTTPKDYPALAVGAVSGGFIAIGTLGILKNVLSRLGF